MMANRDNIFVIGAGGNLGRAVQEQANVAGRSIECFSRNVDARYFVDLLASPNSWRLPNGGGAVILLAALTDTAACEQDPALARRVNRDATLELAKRLIDKGYFIVFPSTSQVFDGSVLQPAPDTLTSPQTIYGKLKVEVEKELRAINRELVAIVRIAKVISLKTPLLCGWAKKLLQGESISAFSDMRVAPVSETDTARLFLQLARDKVAGLYHFSSKNDISYYELARIGAKALGVDPALVQPALCKEQGVFSPANAALGGALQDWSAEEVVTLVFQSCRQELVVDD